MTRPFLKFFTTWWMCNLHFGGAWGWRLEFVISVGRVEGYQKKGMGIFFHHNHLCNIWAKLKSQWVQCRDLTISKTRKPFLLGIFCHFSLTTKSETFVGYFCQQTWQRVKFATERDFVLKTNPTEQRQLKSKLGVENSKSHWLSSSVNFKFTQFDR